MDQKQRLMYANFLTEPLATDPYYSSQEREDTRASKALLGTGLAGAGLYGLYRSLNIPVTPKAIEFIKGIPFIGEQAARRAADLLVDPGKALPHMASELHPEMVFRPGSTPTWQKIPPGTEGYLGQTWESFTGIGVYGSDPTDPLKVVRREPKVKHLLFEMVRSFEDNFGKVPRTFQMSALLSSEAFEEGTYSIPGKQAKRLYTYLQAAFPEVRRANISVIDLARHGLTYERGSLFLGVGEQKRRKIASSVRIMLHDAITEGTTDVGGRLTKSLEGVAQAERFRPELARTILGVYGSEEVGDRILAIPVPASRWGETIKEAVRRISRSKSLREAVSYLSPLRRMRGIPELEGMATLFFRRYAQVLDDPIRALEEITGKTFPSASRMWKRVGLKNIFGTGGVYNLPLKQLIARHFTRGVPVMVGLYGAYKLLDSFIRRSPIFDLTGLSEGIPGAVGTGFKNLDLAYSTVSEKLGLTRVAEGVEKTHGHRVGLLNLLAIPASFSLAGGLGSYLYGKVGLRVGKGKAASAAYLSRRSEDVLSKVLGKTGGRIAGFLEKRGIRVTPGRAGAIIGAAAGLGALLLDPLAILGAFGARKRTDELRAEYEGRRDVTIRKGRGWFFGRSSFEGTRGTMTVPNWYQRNIIQAREKQLYKERDQNRPIRRFIKSLFDPHWLAKQHYYDRPTPTDTASGEFSQAWALTVGRILKPPVYLHGEELFEGGNVGGPMRVGPARGAEGQFLPSLGGMPQEQSEIQSGWKYQLHQFGERWLRTKPGLLGYAFSSLKQMITGSPTWADEYSYLQSFSEATRAGREYWESEYGDIAFSTEAFRRVLMNRRYGIEYVNPLSNQLATWLPGPGDKAIDFSTGDPYSKIPIGELRLPGAGFVARYPELKGVPAEQYPDAYKYKILADVAPFSAQTRHFRARLEAAQEADMLSPREQLLFAEAQRTYNERIQGHLFAKEPQGFFGHYWAALKGFARALPTEFLTPIAPAHKFAGPPDPLQAYQESLIAPEFAPWNEPIESFILPALRATGNMALMGHYGVPHEVQDRRELDQYFDMLSYTKAAFLRNMAGNIKRKDLYNEYMAQTKRTVFGGNAFGTMGDVFSAIPANEREYFKAFEGETSASRRDRILNLSPPNLERYYKARWLINDVQDSILQSPAARLALQEGEMSEGFDASGLEDLQAMAHDSEARINGTWADKLRFRRMADYFADKDLPPPSWIGFHPGVDLSDIKMKMLNNEGEDIHNHNLWESQQNELWRKPYLEEAVEGVADWEDAMLNQLEVRRQLSSMLSSVGIRPLQILVEHSGGSSKNRLTIDIEQDRTSDVAAILRSQGITR